MATPATVTAIVGSYRKGGIIDTAVDELLASAREEGAETAKIYLTDRQIEFCTNCTGPGAFFRDKKGCP